jgi:hypothetical protein
MKKVFGTVLIIITLFFIFLFFSGKTEGYWFCDKNQNWTKQGNPSYPKPVKSCYGNPALPKNQADCLSQGGVWEKQGPEPFASCDRKAIDRGNLCRDNGECEGMCQVSLTRDELSLGMRGKLNVKKNYGQCSVWVVELGCNGIMKQGKPQVICIE